MLPTDTHQSASPVLDAVLALKELVVLAGVGCFTGTEGYIILKQTLRLEPMLRLEGRVSYVPSVCVGDWQVERQQEEAHRRNSRLGKETGLHMVAAGRHS